MKPPKKIYAKVEKRNGEEVLRLSTSPFLNGNIEYYLNNGEPSKKDNSQSLG